jgi:hypothetical protein
MIFSGQYFIKAALPGKYLILSIFDSKITQTSHNEALEMLRISLFEPAKLSDCRASSIPTA